MSNLDRPYIGPNGTERPGEHWNARLIREEAERRSATTDAAKAYSLLADRIVQAVRNPDSIAPRNGHKESDAEWAARVVGYVLAEQAVPAHDTSQPTPPFPLAMDDKVTVDVDAKVYARPDPEDEPGEGFYVFELGHNSGGALIGLTQDEVIARVRKA